MAITSEISNSGLSAKVAVVQRSIDETSGRDCGCGYVRSIDLCCPKLVAMRCQILAAGRAQDYLELLSNHDETSTAGTFSSLDACRVVETHKHPDTQPAGADVLL